jgi:hypothetical protein
MLAIFLLLAGFAACGGGSSPSTSPTDTPTPTAPRGTWTDIAPITVGAVEGNPSVGNTIPFGGNSATFPGTTYQQVYLGSLFGSGQIRLTAIEYFATISGREVVSANYTLSMSTTTRAIEALDPANLASNIGSNAQTVFSGTLGPGAVVDARLRINLSNPFVFTPGSGNLLLQVARANAGPNTSAGFLHHAPNDGFPSGLSSRAHDFGVISSAGAAFYLVTRFYPQHCVCPTDAPCTC